MRVWLSAASISVNGSPTAGMKLEAGNKVSSWYDLSGHQNHISQGTVGSQPVYSSATRGISYDGVDDRLSRGTYKGGALGSSSIIAVVELSNASQTGTVVAGGYRIEVAGNSYKLSSGAGGTSITGQATDTNAAIIIGTVNGTNGVIYKNTSSGVSGSSLGSSTMNGITVGAKTDGSVPMSGVVKEVLVINGVISSANQTAIIQYLSGKWGLTVSAVTNASGNLSSGSNWVGGSVPAAGSAISIATSNNNITWNLATSNWGQVTLSSGYTGTVTVTTGLNASGVSVNGGTLVIGSGGVLNTPTLSGSVTISGGGLTIGGSGTGTMTITGNLTQSAGTVTFNIKGGSAGTYDVLNVGGAAAINGTIALDLSGMNTGSVTNNVITILSGNPISGTPTISVSNVPAGMIVDTSTLKTNGTIRLINLLSDGDNDGVPYGKDQYPTDPNKVSTYQVH